MIGRLLSNVIVLIPKVKPIYLHNVFLFVAGASCAAIPFCDTFSTMAAASFSYGLFMGEYCLATATFGTFSIVVIVR